jgi:hypothetical protein
MKLFALAAAAAAAVRTVFTAPVSVAAPGGGAASRRAFKRHLAAATTVLAFLATTTGGLALSSGTAQAQDVVSGSLTFTGDPGDYIAGDNTYTYSPDAGDRLEVTSATDHNSVYVSVTGAHGDWWYLNLAAPSGQELKPGVYAGATRYPFEGATEPGLSLYGDGRGCNEVTGTFTVTNVDFGPQGYVHEFDATFEQHCEGFTAAARGEIHITNPPPPPVLDLGLGVDVDGSASTLNGKATVHGTVTCNEPVHTTVSGNVTQVSHRVLINGHFSIPVDCTPDAPAPWTATATPTGTTPFAKGDAEVDATATAPDPTYGQYVTTSQTTAVHLAKDRPSAHPA